jgi:hypothetical protein
LDFFVEGGAAVPFSKKSFADTRNGWNYLCWKDSFYSSIIAETMWSYKKDPTNLQLGELNREIELYFAIRLKIAQNEQEMPEDQDGDAFHEWHQKFIQESFGGCPDSFGKFFRDKSRLYPKNVDQNVVIGMINYLCSKNLHNWLDCEALGSIVDGNLHWKKLLSIYAFYIATFLDVKFAGVGFNIETIEENIAHETERMLHSRAMFEEKKANSSNLAAYVAERVAQQAVKCAASEWTVSDEEDDKLLRKSSKSKEKRAAKIAATEWTVSDEEDMAARIGKHVKTVRKYPSLRVKEDKADDPLLQQMLLETELESEENLAEENLQKYGETPDVCEWDRDSYGGDII